MTQDAETRLWDMARAFQPSRILLSALELGVFAALGDKPKTSEEVAELIDADPRATNRLMNALVAIGLLVRHDDLFGNSPDVEELLVPGKPGYAGDAMMHAANMWKTWSTLTEAVRDGTSVYQPEASAEPGRAKAFIAAMHYFSSDHAPEIASLVDLTGVRRILDVGGGSGGYSIAFCRAIPDVEAVVFDLPEIVPLTQRYVAEAGLSERVTTHAGDYLEDEFGSGFDLVFLSHILHANSPAENVELLRKSRRAFRPGGRVTIQDFVMESNRTHPAQAAVFALNMLVATKGGDTYTRDEITSWLAEVGFVDIKQIDEPSGYAVLLSAGNPQSA